MTRTVSDRSNETKTRFTDGPSGELKPARQIYTTFYCVAGGRRPTTNSVNIKQISAANSLTRECLDNYPAIISDDARDNVDAHRLADVNTCLTNGRRVYAERSPKSYCRTSRSTLHITLSPLLGLKLYQASNSKRLSLGDVSATYLEG